MKKSGAPFLLGSKVLPGPFPDPFWTILGLIFGPFWGSATRSVSVGQQDWKHDLFLLSFSGRANVCVLLVISKNVQKPMGFCTFLDITNNTHTFARPEKLNRNKSCFQSCWPTDTERVAEPQNGPKMSPKMVQKGSGKGPGRTFEPNKNGAPLFFIL